jgi:hypothetical protein
MNRALVVCTLCVSSVALTACLEDDVPVAENGDGGGSGEDGGREAAPNGDAPAGDAPRSDALPPDSSSHPEGGGDASGPTQLAEGMDLTVWGVTSDGYIIYSDAASSYAVPLAGGTSTVIDAISGPTYLTVAGPLVEIAVGYNSISSPGTLKTWSEKGGLHTISSKAFVYTYQYQYNQVNPPIDGPVGGSSRDFASIAYFDNYDAAANTADAYVANVDGTGATLLQASVQGVGISVTSVPTCSPVLSFVGSSAVLGYCPTVGSSTGNITSYAPPSWSSVPVAADVAIDTLDGVSFSFGDPSGTNILLQGSSGLEVIAVAGGVPTTIDPNGSAIGALFTSDGADVVYLSVTGALLRSPVASPSPSTLVTSGLFGISGLSPDNATALVSTAVSSTTFLSNLYEASATTSGSLTTLSAATSTEVPGILGGSSFTNDSSHALFYSSVTTDSTTFVTLGTLQAAPVGSSSLVTLASNSINTYASGNTKVVFDANYTLPASSKIATVDLLSVDLSTSAGPSTLATGAIAYSYALSPDGSQLVYSKLSGGLFVTKVP